MPYPNISIPPLRESSYILLFCVQPSNRFGGGILSIDLSILILVADLLGSSHGFKLPLDEEGEKLYEFFIYLIIS